MLLHVDSCAWAMFGPKLSALYWQHHAVTWPKVFAGPGVHIYRKLQKHTWKAEFVQWACQEILPTIRIQKADLENEQVKASIWHEYDQARTCQLRLTSFNDIMCTCFLQYVVFLWSKHIKTNAMHTISFAVGNDDQAMVTLLENKTVNPACQSQSNPVFAVFFPS